MRAGAVIGSAGPRGAQRQRGAALVLVVLGGLAAVVGLVVFVSHGPWTALRTTTRTRVVPTLGYEAPPKGTVTWFDGLGTPEPRVIGFGGVSPEGDFSDVTWTSWGGPRAIGTGWTYDVDRGPVRLRVVALGLGHCDGHLAYRFVTGYSPALGEHLSTSSASLIPVCNGPGLDWYHPASLAG